MTPDRDTLADQHAERTAWSSWDETTDTLGDEGEHEIASACADRFLAIVIAIVAGVFADGLYKLEMRL